MPARPHRPSRMDASPKVPAFSHPNRADAEQGTTIAGGRIHDGHRRFIKKTDRYKRQNCRRLPKTECKCKTGQREHRLPSPRGAPLIPVRFRLRPSGCGAGIGWTAAESGSDRGVGENRTSTDINRCMLEHPNRAGSHRTHQWTSFLGRPAPACSTSLLCESPPTSSAPPKESHPNSR